MVPVKSTPMMQQYLSIKAEHPDVLLLYRMGDFYEMFFEDAKLASRVLDITLTSRNKNTEEQVPMCGVPYRAVRGYIARLIENGYKVALCDQVEDPKTAKGLVRREVVRVITPGMIVEDDLLDAKTNNFVMAVCVDQKEIGLASLDISTGAFRLTQSTDVSAVADEILRIGPREILVSGDPDESTILQPMAQRLSQVTLTPLDSSVFSLSACRQRLLDQFGVLSLEGFGCETLFAGIRAAGGLMYYIGETQRQKLDHLHGIQTYFLGAFLVVDDASCRNLELMQNIRSSGRTGTLLEVMDQTLTAMGARQMIQWLRYPLLDAAEISRRQDAVADAVEKMQARKELRQTLKSIRDLERLGAKVAMGNANARDLTALKQTLTAVSGMDSLLSAFSANAYHYTGDLHALDDLADLIDKAIREDAPPVITEGNIICQGYDDELDELILISRDGKSWLAALESREREATGINSLKVRFNKVFGYYIEISRTHSESVPAHYVRKQTLVNAERYITDDLKQFESRVLTAEEQRASLELRLFLEVREKVNARHADIQSIAQFIARIDCFSALAELAHENDYCRPRINTDRILNIIDGRHPVVEKRITGERFVPNTIRMDAVENQVLIITGPNMAGKSTVLRQAALITLMAQMGSFVPAKAADVALTDRIFTRVGALDNLSAGQSTFMVEMQETANIINNATPDSLVILDEIGRGTSTYDGLSIAWAVAEYLHDLDGTGTRTLFATHYHELTELAGQLERVKNYNIAVKESRDTIIFLRKLVEGGTNRSYGIQVARLAGIPDTVISRAKTILNRVESGMHPTVEKKLRIRKNAQKESEFVQLGLFSLQGRDPFLPKPDHME
ncbi:DNA mismatch repair protein MutS [Desulfosarcina sp. OttesenSCG-928-A07]|nr:DNA mismatch repair protein MutS [Desulfosarcina sp. OttesenSCG-928-G17]MDL2329612.1 DNA mismatch repair protein MutS [Desulfosarcina sp. OttesenSCG-928-A07]